MIKRQDSARPRQRVFRRFFRYLLPRRHVVLAAYLCMLLATATMVAVPQFIRWIVDRGIAEQDVLFVGRAVAALLVLSVIRAVFTFAQGRLTEVVSQGVAANVRMDLFSRLTVMSVGLMSRIESGQLLQRAIQDVERIRFLTGRAVLRVADAALLFFATLAVLLAMNPLLGALALATMPLLALRGYQYARRQRPLSSRLQQQLGKLTGVVEQNLRGARLVKAFAQEQAEIERFDRENHVWFGLAKQNAQLTAINAPLMDLIANLGLVVVIGVGGVLTIDGELTLGELVAFTTYLTQLFAPIRRVGLVIPHFAQAAASAERVAEVLDAPPAVVEQRDALRLPSVRGAVSFDGVSYRYDPTDAPIAPNSSDAGTSPSAMPWALRDIDLHIPAGTTVALLGATGSGKSTLINLILRLDDPTEGVVSIDGYDLRTVRLRSIRRQIGVVLQDPVLFAASIRDNIAFGRQDADLAEVRAAAEAACIDAFITGLDKGYETMVGERGVTLSGGQRQRIAIARALLVDPRILLLDDATASVDAGTEQTIHEALARLLPGRTAFIIAHRLSTLQMADLIVVLEHGRITARGRHEQLVRTSELYQRLCQEQQFRLPGQSKSRRRREARR